MKPYSALANDEVKAKIKGKVTSEGSPVPGATIVIQGTNTGAITETDGTFLLEVDKGKEVQIKISSVGFVPKTLTITPNKTENEQALVVELEPEASSLGAVTVTSSSNKAGSVNLIYNTQKNSSTISDAISSDIIRKSPDKNTSDVLKRVSGVSVQDNKFVIIRGLNERYNAAILNNSILPSTEPDRRAFAFDIIPASMIEQMVIYKSAKPDLPGDFAGGAIKITTKEFPTHKTDELSLSLGYNSLTTFKEFKNAIPKGKYDFLGYFDDKRDIPADYYDNRQDFIHKPTDFKKQVTKSFPSTFGYRDAANSLPDISANFTHGNTRFYGDSKKLGYIYSLGYGMSRSMTQWGIDDYAIDKRQVYRSNSAVYSKNYSLNAMANLAYSFNRDNTLTWKNLYNNKLVSSTALRDGANLANTTPLPFISSSNKAQQDGLLNSVLEGIHVLSDAQKFDWNTSYSLTYRNQPDERILTLNENEDGGYERKISNQNSPELQNTGRVYSHNKEQIFGANANYQYSFDAFGQTQLLKIGSSNYYRLKNVEVNALGYATTTAYGAVIPANPDDLFNLFTPENIDQYSITVANIGTSSADYKGTAWNNSGYVMLENKLSPKWSLSWGARLESYRQKIEPVDGKILENSNLDVLPSGVLTYKLNEKTNIRLAGAQSVNRPEFRELADYSVYDYNTDFNYRGNPNLVRSKNTNADLRYEFFPGAGQIISASVFYKHFKDPIEQINQGNGVLSYQNAESATLYGAELEIRKKLDFIGGDFFNHLIFYSNLSYIDGDIQLEGYSSKSLMQGQSPYILNGGLNYVQNDFSFNILYNKIGPRLAYRGQGEGQMNIYEKPRDVIDAQISKKFLKSKRLEIKISISDLLAQPVSWYYKFNPSTEGVSHIGYDATTDKITRHYKEGSTSTLSLKYNF